MRDIKTVTQIKWPTGEISENFQFETVTQYGTFTLLFKWLNNRWNCWVTLPSGDVRQAGVYPNVTSWLGFLDYGLIFYTALQNIQYDELFTTELYLVEWL